MQKHRRGRVLFMPSGRCAQERRAPWLGRPMTGTIQPNEFRYHDDRAFRAAVVLLAMASVLLLSSVVTGLWGVAALAHAHWLDANDLPVGGADTWGIGMLILASIQGITALLIIFAPRLGTFLGIGIAMLNILINLAVITAFPIGSLVSIAINLVIITVLHRSRRRR